VHAAIDHAGGFTSKDLVLFKRWYFQERSLNKHFFEHRSFDKLRWALQRESFLPLQTWAINRLSSQQAQAYIDLVRNYALCSHVLASAHLAP
jgi:hypothetical protein